MGMGRGYGPPPKIFSLMAMPASSASMTPVVQWLRQRNFEAVRNYYSAVWVYGDPSFYDTIGEYGLSGELGEKAHYVGYLDQCTRLASSAAAPARDAVLGNDGQPYFLCSVGGGRDGAALCQAFLQAALPAGHRGILVTGTQMAQEMRNELKRLGKGRSEMLVVEFVREPIALMAGASGIIAMGGYNTVCEVLSLERPALIVPRALPRAEQSIRAERLAARGLIDVLASAALDAQAVSRWMAAPRPALQPARQVLDLRGLSRVSDLADAMLAPIAAPLALSA
jgi:predicted glycosyltransferase